MPAANGSSIEKRNMERNVLECSPESCLFFYLNRIYSNLCSTVFEAIVTLMRATQTLMMPVTFWLGFNRMVPLTSTLHLPSRRSLCQLHFGDEVVCLH